jgi:hypothetical protein
MLYGLKRENGMPEIIKLGDRVCVDMEIYIGTKEAVAG